MRMHCFFSVSGFSSSLTCLVGKKKKWENGKESAAGEPERDGEGWKNVTQISFDLFALFYFQSAHPRTHLPRHFSVFGNFPKIK